MDGAPFLQLLFVLVFIQSFSHQLCSQPFNILRKSNLLKAELCIFDLHSLDNGIQVGYFLMILVAFCLQGLAFLFQLINFLRKLGLLVLQ
jgi:hypothetical protein